MERPNAWKNYRKTEIKKAEALAEAYKRFLDCGKTERECTAYAVNTLEQAGYISLDRALAEKKKLKAGDKVYVNQMNKAVVAKFLLISEDNAHAVDTIVHPAVFRDFEASGIKWMESAILYESGAYRLVDKTIVVTAPEEIRIQRVMQRDGISREKVLEWMARQLPQEEIRRKADFEIVNDGEANIEQQLNKILRNMKETILAIAGKPGLYKLVSRGKNNLIVEALDATHRRQPAFATDRITSLGDIAMFTETDDVPLMTVLDNMKNVEGGKKASINEKKASGKELQDYFTKVLPEWDRDRVQNSHIKKLITWYNILIENGITDFKTEEPEEEKTED